MTTATLASLGLAVAGLLGAPLAVAQDTSDAPAPAPSEPAPAPSEPAPAPAEPAPAPPAAAPPAETAAAPVEAPPSEAPPEEKHEDGGLGLEWVWLNADLGFSYADLGSVSTHNLGITTAPSSGGAFGLGAGVRLLGLTLGLRARDLPLSVGNVVELDGEVGFHSSGSFQMYFGARGGYLFSGNLSANALANATADGGTPNNVSFHGGNFGLMLGFDYYFNHYISLGIDANPEFMFISRPPPALPPFPTPPAGISCTSGPAAGTSQCMKYNSALASYNAIKANPVYKESGSSVGVGFIGALHLGVHF
jgi:hypothetical protein